MTDLALIAALQRAGVAVTPQDDPAVIRGRLHARIMRVLASVPEDFDQVRYDRLMELHAALPPETEDAGDAD